jgi:hypothetical protein
MRFQIEVGSPQNERTSCLLVLLPRGVDCDPSVPLVRVARLFWGFFRDVLPRASWIT